MKAAAVMEVVTQMRCFFCEICHRIKSPSVLIIFSMTVGEKVWEKNISQRQSNLSIVLKHDFDKKNWQH